MKNKSKLICKLFGHKMDNSDVADFTCLNCGQHFKIEWPRPPAKGKEND